MATTDFFTDQTEQSRTKARIVTKYFDGWSNVLTPVARLRGEPIQYIDLFAGPGRYEDGSESTPLLVLRQAIAKPKIHDMFVSVFNDSVPGRAAALRTAIDALPGIGILKHKPKVHNEPVDDQAAALFEHKSMVPTLTFIDPFGYKDLSMRLIQGALNGLGCDCIFFFNFNRVNAAISRQDVEDHILGLFDTDNAGPLRQRLAGLPPYEREKQVIEELITAIKKKPGRYVCNFGFTNDEASRTSHHLVFVSKHPKGCKIMKAIMAKESSWSEGGLPSFVCSPKPKERSLFDNITDLLEELDGMLLDMFAGKRLTVGKIYEQHGLGSLSGRRFLLSNYKNALKKLEASGQVVATPAASERRAGTMADNVIIQFPAKGS